MADVILSTVNQRLLAERVRAGDSSAEDELIRIFHPPVVALLVCRTHDREVSRDLAQDVLIAALQAVRAGSVNDPEKLGTYIQGIARNLANNYIRTRTIQRQREDELPPELGDRIAAPLRRADLDETEREKAVLRALEGLEASDRNVLRMTLDGRQPREIAKFMNIRADLVRQRKLRAIQKIKDSMRKLSRTGNLRHFVNGVRQE
jgi:RNA polymerase sigma factor (sigma-70 family)